MAAATSLIQPIMGNISTAHTARENAYQARRNAQIARDSASIQRKETAQAEEAQRREARKVLGSAAASMAQNGGGFDDLLMKDMSREAEYDAMNISYGGEMEAQDLDYQALQFDADKRNYGRLAKHAAWGGSLGAAAFGLSTVADYRISKAKKRAENEERSRNVQNTKIQSKSANSGVKGGIKSSKGSPSSWQDTGLNWNSGSTSKLPKAVTGKGK